MSTNFSNTRRPVQSRKMSGPKTCTILPAEYFPNPLTHGILAAHCATVYDYSDYVTKFKNSVTFSDNHALVVEFSKVEKININEHICNWKVLKCEEEKDTGYLGIIYINEVSRHLVVTHRSTNLELSLKKENLLKFSSLHQDIEGVLIGNITLHQANGYLLTAKAVDLVQSSYQNYSLSFSGHSLGAWLAELSVLYCHDSLDFQYARAITFDGPGSLEMMQTLRTGDITGPISNDKCKLEDLDIISYLSAPNVVNSANKHVGMVYRIFPENTKDVIIKKLPSWCVNISFIKDIAAKVIDRNCLELMSLGHSLHYILPYFNLESGKPKYCKQVEKWPSITYDSFSKYSSGNLVTTAILKALAPLTSKVSKEMNIQESGVNVNNKVIFHWNHTTLDSIAHLVFIFFKGKINLQQFWLVHKYLNKDCGFIENPQNLTDEFFLQYKAQYKVSEVNLWTRKKTGDKIDKCLKYLESNKNNVQGDILRGIVNIYLYEKSNEVFTIKEQYRTSGFTMEGIRDTIRGMFRRDPDFEKYVNNISKVRLFRNIELPISIARSTTEKIVNSFSNGCNILVIKGISGLGKTTLAKTYGKEHDQNITTRLLLANSKSVFEQSLAKCSKSLMENKNPSLDDTAVIHDHLDTTKQRVLFILDDVKQGSHISHFIDKFSSSKNIKIIITTQHDKLFPERDIPEISSSYSPGDEAKSRLQTYVKSELDKLIRKYKSDSRYIADIIKFVAILNTGTLSEDEILHNLCIPSVANVVEILDVLKSLSFVTVDGSGCTCVHTIVQNAALEISEFQSASELLTFVSSFGSKYMTMSSVLYKLMTFDLSKEFQRICELESKLDVEKKCNLQNIVVCLLDEFSLKSELRRDGNAEVLSNLSNRMVETIDKKLQLLMTNLVDGWIDAQKQDLKGQFLNDRRDQITEFLKTFSNFQKRVHYEGKRHKVDQQYKQCKHVFVIGPTGSGKSTVINSLIGNTLECVQIGRNGAETKINVISKKNNPVAKIGNTLISETNSIAPYYNEKLSTVYWDFPGFFDTRGDMQKIQHAFLLKSFSESLANSKILLVTESSMVTTVRGESFVHLIGKLSHLCPLDKFKNCVSLLITKCDPFVTSAERDTDKRHFLKVFEEIFQSRRKGSHSTFLELLKTNNIFQRIALYSRVTKIGYIKGDIFQDLYSAIDSSDCDKIVFSLNVDDDVTMKIVHLSDMLNSFAEHITQEIVNDRIRKLKSELQEETFGKGKLSLKAFTLATNKEDLSADRLSAVLRDATVDQIKAHLLLRINEVMSFFHYLNCTSFANVDNWLAPFITFNSNFKELMRPAIADFNDPPIMKIRVPILFSSDIQKLFNDRKCNVDRVETSSLLFIMDSDLDLPGIDLAISSVEWKIIQGREIRLVGTWGTEKKNSGNFYGYAKNISGGKISFILDGIDGEDGEFDLSKSEQINNTCREIERMKSQLSAIETLKTYKEGSLDLENQRSYLKSEEKNSKQILKDLKDQLKVINRKSTAWSTKSKNDNLRIKSHIEKDIETQNGKIKDLYDEKKVIDKLIEMVSIQNEYAAFPRRYSVTGLKRANSIIDKPELVREVMNCNVEINKISESIDDLGTKQVGDQIKFKELVDILERTKNIHLTMKKVVQSQDKTFCKWQEKLAELEEKVSQRHSICVNGFTLELNSKELNDIFCQNKSEFQSCLEKAVKVEVKKLKDLHKQIHETRDCLERFKRQHQKRKNLKGEKDKKYKYMVELRAQLRKTLPNEFRTLDSTIEKIRIATVGKEKMSRRFDAMMAQTEEPDEMASRSNRELLKPVLKGEFTKGFREKVVNSKNNNSQQKWDKLTALLKQHTEIHAKIELLRVKESYNVLFNQYESADKFKYQINESEHKLSKELDDIRSQLKKLCFENDIFSDYIKANVLNDSELDTVVQMQYLELENLQKKMEFAKEHRNKMADTLDQLTRANDEYNSAKIEYDNWKQNNRSGKAPVLDYFLKIYEEFLECDKMWKQSFETEAKIAQELLLKECNLISRKELKWNDRGLGGKTAFVVKEMFIFTRQYYEKYVISGSDGLPGSNSGAFEFRGGESHIGTISQSPGQGGQHACVLEGTYANEYSFPFLRGIQQKLNNENAANKNQIKDVIWNSAGFGAKFVDESLKFILKNGASTASNASTVATSSAQVLSGSFYFLTAIALIASPIVATLWSHWVDGPYKYDRCTATHGEMRKIDSSILNKCQTEFSQYIQEELQQNLLSLILKDS